MAALGSALDGPDNEFGCETEEVLDAMGDGDGVKMNR